MSSGVMMLPMIVTERELELRERSPHQRIYMEGQGLYERVAIGWV